jgi:hypothetical protein
LCSGELYDSGGPDSTYSNNENFTYVICPSDPNECITFNMTYYNIEQGGFGSGDQLYIYDGDDTNSPLLADISNSNFTIQWRRGRMFLCPGFQWLSDGTIYIRRTGYPRRFSGSLGMLNGAL